MVYAVAGSSPSARVTAAGWVTVTGWFSTSTVMLRDVVPWFTSTVKKTLPLPIPYPGPSTDAKLPATGVTAQPQFAEVAMSALKVPPVGSAAMLAGETAYWHITAGAPPKGTRQTPRP